MVSFAGDTLSIVQPIRMLSCDTPEKEGFAGRAETVQPHLDRCAEGLRGDFYAAIPGPMREHLWNAWMVKPPFGICELVTAHPAGLKSFLQNA